MDATTIIFRILLLIGMWKFMSKARIKKLWAFIPGYRFYKLGEFAGMEEEGVTLMLCTIIMEILSCASSYFVYINKGHLRTSILLILPQMVLSMAVLVYRFRIASVLCNLMKKPLKHRTLWSVLFQFVPCIPLLVWGFSPAYQFEEKQDETDDAAELLGTDQAILKKGLTINLNDRSIKEHFKKKYLLRDIHMNITPNKMVLLLGGSGAGKTTFLNAITGYEPANAIVTLNGENVYQNFNKMKYEIGFVPQQDLIRYQDTVQRTLTDAASLRLPTGYSRKEKMARVEQVLELFGLSPVRNNLVAKGSGGQKKRISIATEFISDPSLFILDEPDSGLDGILARELMEQLHQISRQEKIVIVITHTPDRVIDLFDEVIVLGKDANRTGRLVFHGSIDHAREFFHVDKMEEIIRKINCVDEGGEGLTDELIEKYEEARNGN